MAKVTLFVDTDILVDYLGVRQPFYEDAQKLMFWGRLGEFKLWMSASQVTDLLYVLTQGGRKENVRDALKAIQGLRTFVEVFPVGPNEVDAMLMTDWADPEDALLYECALRVGADAVVTRNAIDFENCPLEVADCAGIFAWLRKELGVDYAEIRF